MIQKTILISFILHSLLLSITCNEDIWESDLSSDMKIGLSDSGYEKVALKCGASSMQVDLTTEEEFTGVIYTRGSFYSKESPCFLDPGPRGGRSFTLKFPLDRCNTTKNGEVYTNVLVVQNDKELIMPGDSAFNLECDFTSPKEFTVKANINSRKNVHQSKIYLVSADPGSDEKRLLAVERGDTVAIDTKQNYVREEL